ncbi:MAG: DUF916 and DUF3324 domain-containing protein [Clostridioides sp.]|jgi:hypothetical protein|nr:DUF916 and DUF3324 domain-containing protein [Clostridioides sp.]
MRKKIAVLISSLVLVLGMSTGMVNALDSDFTVSANIPENQVDKSKSYFDVLVTPGQQETLEVVVKNTGDKDIIILPTVNSATSSPTGVINYGDTDAKKDSTLKYSMKDIIKVDKEVSIPKNSEKVVQFKLTAPAEKFDGILAGGFTFRQKEEEKKTEETQTTGANIKNTYAFIIGVVLHQDDSKNINADLRLNDVKATQSNARTIIASNLQNPVPRYIRDMSIKTKVYKKGDKAKKTLFSASDEKFQMAPNSNFDHMTRLNGERIEAGTYYMHLEANAGANHWEFDKEFTVTDDQAKDLNASDVDVKDYTWIIVGAIAAVVVIAGIIFFVVKKKKKSIEEE